MAHLSAASILQKTLALTIVLAACTHAVSASARDCEGEWKKSSAAKTCTLTYSGLSSGVCTIQSRCKTSVGTLADMLRTTWILDDVSSLDNSGGWLSSSRKEVPAGGGKDNPECMEQWGKSPASKTCSVDFMEAHGTTCSVSASCDAIDGDSVRQLNHYHFDSVSKLGNKDGVLDGTKVADPAPGRYDYSQY